MHFLLNLFVPGRSYRVLSGFDSWQWKFVAGEELVFVRETYSFYDSASLFEFRSVRSGEMKQIVVYDDMAPAQIRSLITELD